MATRVRWPAARPTTFSSRRSSGLASITGGPEAPARVGMSIVDVSTGATAHAAILEGLIGRGRTGQGADIRISMFDVMADWLTVPLLHAENGRPPQRIGLAHPSISPYGVFPSNDGAQILISIQNEREWRLFCRHVLQDEAIADDPRFCTNVARVAHRAETDGMVARLFQSLPRAEVLRRLALADTAFAEVNDMAALSAHPHLRRTTVATPNGPLSLPGAGAAVRRCPAAVRPRAGDRRESSRQGRAVAQFLRWAMAAAWPKQAAGKFRDVIPGRAEGANPESKRLKIPVPWIPGPPLRGVPE